MKKIFAIFLLIAILIASLSFVSCGKTLKYKDGYYYCSQNGVTYQMVSFEYVPVAIGAEYATLTDGLIDNKLYEIKGASPEKWLATADGNLFCAKGEKIPTLDEMEINSIVICYEQEAVISLATIKDAAEVDTVIDIFKNGNEIEYPIGNESSEFLKLRMTSEKYPWLYYNLTYVEYIQDICEYDYPEDLNSYEYRNVSEDVAVETYEEYELWYAVTSKNGEESYLNAAKNAGIKCGTLTKPDGKGSVVDYVILVFEEERTVEDCVNKILENYTGVLTENKIRDMFSSPTSEKEINVIEYNYGKCFIYDRVSGKCVKAGDIVHKYKNGTPTDQESK